MMQFNRSKIAGAALIAVALGGLTTVAVAENGPMGGPRGMGPGFERIFADIDADKDGKVTKAEADAWKAAQPRVQDTNGDGKIGPDELAAPRIAEATARANDRAADMVKRLDTDGDGLLSAAELAQGPGFGPRGDGPDMDRIFDRIDADKDGAITQDEVKAAHDRMADRRDDRRGERGKGERHGNHDHGPGKGHDRPAQDGEHSPPPAEAEGGN